MIERARHYVTSTARVLEQRRFELLFGDGGDRAAIAAALDAYRTPDGGYGYALEPDGRGPTSQPPHLWTALEVLEEIGATDPRLPDHLAAISAPDGGLPVALPTIEPYPRAPWWTVGTEGTLLATALIHAKLPGESPWKARAEAFCWDRIEALEHSHPYELAAAVAFLDAVADRPRAEAAAERLGTLSRESPAFYAEGEVHRPHDFAKTPDSLARAWFTDAEIEASLDHLVAQQGDGGGWPVAWAIWTPAIAVEWSGLVTITALKTLRAYGRA